MHRVYACTIYNMNNNMNNSNKHGQKTSVNELRDDLTYTFATLLSLYSTWEQMLKAAFLFTTLHLCESTELSLRIILLALFHFMMTYVNYFIIKESVCPTL